MQLRPREGAEPQRVLDPLRRIVRALAASSRASQGRLGVTGAQLFVLKSLGDRKPISLSQLAERTRTHQSTVSVVVKRLVAKGLVARTHSETDGRRLELGLTPLGRALLRRAPQLAQETLIAGFQKLPPAAQRRLASDLDRLASAMQLGNRPPHMFLEAPPARPRRRSLVRG